jgi:hypothetical protein
MIDELITEEDLTRIRGCESCDHPEKSGFSTAAGSEEGKEIPLLDLKADPVKRF